MMKFLEPGVLDGLQKCCNAGITNLWPNIANAPWQASVKVAYTAPHMLPSIEEI